MSAQEDRMMTLGADLMRAAAKQIRRDWEGSPEAGQESLHDYHMGVAAWLDRAAAFWSHPDAAEAGRPADLDIALSVAAAAIGGTR